uniref:Uncharacterized protein n=1 Tax=Rhizophora mucronata TaxID=61149 RepID=A0A2P2QEI1_RHIMU
MTSNIAKSTTFRPLRSSSNLCQHSHDKLFADTCCLYYSLPMI